MHSYSLSPELLIAPPLLFLKPSALILTAPQLRFFALSFLAYVVCLLA